MRSEASPSSSSCSADCCHFNTLFTMGQININWKTPSRINSLCLGHCGGKFLVENFGWKFLAQKAISNILKLYLLNITYIGCLKCVSNKMPYLKFLRPLLSENIAYIVSFKHFVLYCIWRSDMKTGLCLYLPLDRFCDKTKHCQMACL